MKRLIIATENKDKFREIKKILKGAGPAVISLNQLKRKFKIREDGKTFLANALKKARAVSSVYKDDFVAADDSGLLVDYLKGSPGVSSKRFSGKNATYAKNNRKLLKALGGVPLAKRGAHFFCVVVLCRKGRKRRVFTGKLSGVISKEARGGTGFGYDPVFYLRKYGMTVAQLSLSEKNRISHRAKAFRKLKKYLKKRLQTKG